MPPAATRNHALSRGQSAVKPDGEFSRWLCHMEEGIHRICKRQEFYKLYSVDSISAQPSEPRTNPYDTQPLLFQTEPYE